MLVRTIRQVTRILVLGFAAMGFVAVPVFGKTGLEHLSDFVASPQFKAQEQEAEKQLKVFQTEMSTEYAQRKGESTEKEDSTESPLLHRKRQRNDQQRLDH